MEWTCSAYASQVTADAVTDLAHINAVFVARQSIERSETTLVHRILALILDNCATSLEFIEKLHRNFSVLLCLKTQF